MTQHTLPLMLAGAAVNVALVLLLAPVLDGVERKCRARVQRRVGPPILQTLYDLIKLYGRASATEGFGGPFRNAAPFLAFAMGVVGAAILPSILPYGLGFPGDLIVIAYVLVSVSTITSFGAASSSVPYSVVGGWREASLIMASEVVLGASIAALASASGSLLLSSVMPAVRLSSLKVSSIIALACLAVIAYVEGGKLPFEIAEAEPELAGGVTVSYGGASLALLLHALLVKRVLFIAFFLDLLIPWGWFTAALPYPVSLVVRGAAFVAGLFMASVVFSVIEASSGRSRPGHALSLLKKIAVASGVALIVACFGF